VDGNRAQGVLLGLACGDALGASVEFLPRAAIAERYPDGLRDFTTGGPWNVAIGETTDDTRMALDLARSLDRPGPVDLDDLARRFVAWVEEGPKDVGVTTRHAIELLRVGVPPLEAGARTRLALSPERTASNGSLMRCAPVAIRFAQNREAVRQVSIDTSRITHADERCVWACVALNQAIAHLLTGGAPSELVEAACHDVPRQDVVAAVRGAADRHSSELRGTGYALNALRIAFWAMAMTGSLEDAIVAAVTIGDDTDTNAAVTGALAGALHGADAIPERWRSKLQGREELLALADRLVALANEP
jgi:ADP-ribosyl-[dinitrogen reductase] hydrolase